MFCQSCGKKIESTAKFCPFCGAPVTKNSSSKAKKTKNVQTESFDISRPPSLEVFVKGFRCAGTDSYYAFTYFVPIGISLLGCYLVDNESTSGLGVFLFLAGLIYGFLGRTVIFKRSILYSESEKKFIFNEHSRLKFSKKSISISELKGIRFRFVRSNINGLMDYGKFHVICFDAMEKEKSFSVWFIKKGNAEEFFPVIEYALKSNGVNLEMDKKEDMIEFAAFKKEI